MKMLSGCTPSHYKVNKVSSTPPSFRASLRRKGLENSRRYINYKILGRSANELRARYCPGNYDLAFSLPASFCLLRERIGPFLPQICPLSDKTGGLPPRELCSRPGIIYVLQEALADTCASYFRSDVPVRHDGRSLAQLSTAE